MSTGLTTWYAASIGFWAAAANDSTHNSGTRPTLKYAIQQYKDRDDRELLFTFKKRALVHFAVDTNECYMTTQLAGAETRFLPFNRGDKGGAGNPDNPAGYATAYLWEEIWQRDSWPDLIGRFLHIEKIDKNESMIFPRYHQVDAIRKLIADARAVKTGKNYLVWHSAEAERATPLPGSRTAYPACARP